MLFQIKNIPEVNLNKTSVSIFIAFLALLVSGCGGVNIKLFSDASDPLIESVLEGEAEEKILVLPITGLVSDQPDEGVLGTKPSLVQEVVSRLNKAKKDENIKAIVLQINSLGGTVTASDVLYHEITKIKAEKNLKIVASLMDMATSGGYYLALPSDEILAHPTTVTGSVGVIFLNPDVTGLMDKIGLRVNVYKSGEKKDMASLFRDSSPEEETILRDMIVELGGRFVRLVEKHRNLKDQALDEIASARIFLAEDAKRIGLVDRIGYIQDAVEEAKRLSGAPDDAKIVVYRRTEYPEDHYYNPMALSPAGKNIRLIDLGLERRSEILSPGFYYLWNR